MRDDEITAADVDDQAEETERAVATLIAGGLLGAAIGAGLGLLASRAGAAPARPLPRPGPRRAVERTRRELDDFAGRIEREIRELRRLVTRQRRRGWLR